MGKRDLPLAPEAGPRANLRWDLAPKALERWNPGLHAAVEDDQTISIFEPIGYDWWTGEGVTAKRVSAALRAIGRDNPVTVYINSPGGDMFEGLAIYNLLREHRGEVTTKVLGLAASAASVITEAGDNIEIARAGFLMIHNCWCLAMGNRNDLREMAETMEPFDRAMADIYAARSGNGLEEVQAMMDAETWIGGSQAVERGFADMLLPSDEIREEDETSARASAVRLETILARAGVPRSERRKMLQEFKSGTLRAAGAGTPGATETGTLRAAEVDADPMPRIKFTF